MPGEAKGGDGYVLNVSGIQSVRHAKYGGKTEGAPPWRKASDERMVELLLVFPLMEENGGGYVAALRRGEPGDALLQDNARAGFGVAGWIL